MGLVDYLNCGTPALLWRCPALLGNGMREAS
jgi:hypothetical protein